MDLLVLERAIMAFIEVVYELRDVVPYLLATQSKIQPDGLPWEMVIDETQDENDEVFGSTMYYEDPAIGLDWIVDSNWCTYLFEYFDRAEANLAGHGPDGDEPPELGVLRRVDSVGVN